MIFSFSFRISLDDYGPQETETQNDISGDWWFNVIAIQSEVAQSRSTVIDVDHTTDCDRTDVGAINTCEYDNNKRNQSYRKSLSDNQSFSIDI